MSTSRVQFKPAGTAATVDTCINHLDGIGDGLLRGVTSSVVTASRYFLQTVGQTSPALDAAALSLGCAGLVFQPYYLVMRAVGLRDIVRRQRRRNLLGLNGRRSLVEGVKQSVGIAAAAVSTVASIPVIGALPPIQIVARIFGIGAGIVFAWRGLDRYRAAKAAIEVLEIPDAQATYMSRQAKITHQVGVLRSWVEAAQLRANRATRIEGAPDPNPAVQEAIAAETLAYLSTRVGDVAAGRIAQLAKAVAAERIAQLAKDSAPPKKGVAPKPADLLEGIDLLYQALLAQTQKGKGLPPALQNTLESLMKILTDDLQTSKKQGGWLAFIGIFLILSQTLALAAMAFPPTAAVMNLISAVVGIAISIGMIAHAIQLQQLAKRADTKVNEGAAQQVAKNQLKAMKKFRWRPAPLKVDKLPREARDVDLVAQRKRADAAQAKQRRKGTLLSNTQSRLIYRSV
ncbi:MAG: hypothetical protein ACOYKZ_06700 [Chlamydiia bacterium]